jgi:hypothetical protein
MAGNKNLRHRSGKRQESGQSRPKPIANIAAQSSGHPGGGAGRRDVVEPVPEGVHVDPYITEGHPGYQESGDSEIISPERFASGTAKKATVRPPQSRPGKQRSR